MFPHHRDKQSFEISSGFSISIFKRLTVALAILATVVSSTTFASPDFPDAVPPKAAPTGAPTSTDNVTDTGTDAIGEWIEENGAAYKLFLDVPPTQPKPLYGAPNLNADSFINSNDSFVEAAKQKLFTPPPEALEADSAAAQIKAVMKDLKFGKRCDRFATEKGFGIWGRTVVEEISTGHAPALIEGTEDLRKACPNYDYLGYKEKSYVWVKVLASMSFLESSCNPAANVPGIKSDRRAVGILQLHGGAEQKYAEDCKRGASRSPQETLRCGIQMLNDQLTRTSALFSRESYWGVLRPQGDLVKTKKGKRRALLARIVVGSLKELPLCQRK